MMQLNDFYESFMQGVMSNSDSRGIILPEAFLEEITAYLIEDAELSDGFQLADYSYRGMEAHGYDYDDERRILTLVVHEYYQSETIQTLPIDDLKTKFKRVKTFFEKSIKGLYENIEESSLGYEMAYDIYSKKDQILTVRFVVITNGSISLRKEIDLSSEDVGGYRYEYKVFDINSIFKIYLSKSTQDYDVNIEEMYGKPLPCLKVDTQSENYDSYLLVMPGKLLYKIYDLYGQKLLEENVRTFLQFKGKVNQGLRNTIKERPDMFFAFNNGLTTTANSVEIDEGTDGLPLIKSISGLQIVNGGQTTSAIYAAAKNYKIDIDNIYVQMKLSIIKNKEKQDYFIRTISECANTQNKVSKSDFFSNSPFHKDFKDLSERLYANPKDGMMRKTRWFYERTRGQYLNEQAYLTASQKKQFILDYPKAQVVEKTLLSKSENSWAQLPYFVCKGAQYSCAKFAEIVTNRLEKDGQAITEKYFKDAISKLILFKTIEKIIQDAPWYAGYKSNTVAYTMSLISYNFSENNKFFDFSRIWEKQELDADFIGKLRVITKKVYDCIMQPTADFANINEWTKRPICWEHVKKIDISQEIQPIIDRYNIEQDELYFINKEEKKRKQQDDAIYMQSIVITIKYEVWKKIYDYFKDNKSSLSSIEYGVLVSYISGRMRNGPSEKQAKVLYNLYKRAEELGLNLDV